MRLTEILETVTEDVRPAVDRPYGAYAEVQRSRRGRFSRAIQGPRNSRADQLLRRFS